MRPYLQAGAFVVGVLALIVGAIYLYLNEGDPPPCSPNGGAIKCYSVTQKMCEKSLRMSESICKEWMDKLALTPGRLTGPIMQKCQESFLDTIFSGSRKTNPDCRVRFDEIEGWRRRNQPPN